MLSVVTPLTSSAHAEDTSNVIYESRSGGTRVKVGGVVRSDLTAASYMHTKDAPHYTENATAAINILDGLITASGVSTYQRTTNLLNGGITITSEAKIAGVSLFDGAITADAIETKATATLANGNLTRTGNTKFVNLHVRDHDLGLTVGKNTTIEIPGLAKVVLNEVQGQMGGDSLIKSVATGIHVTLLQSYNGTSAGASIEVTPTFARIALPTPIEGIPVYGVAYSTRARVHVGDAIKMKSAPTSAIIMPAGGTNGMDLTNYTARVNVPGLLEAHGLSGTANGLVTPTETDGTMTAKIADLSLFDGRITADAITSTAHLHVFDGSPPTANGTSHILNLVIDGKSYPVDAQPNTVIEIPHLVKVIINEQQRSTGHIDGITVRALHVIALPDAPNDVAGLDLEVGVAAVWVYQ